VSDRAKWSEYWSSLFKYVQRNTPTAIFVQAFIVLSKNDWPENVLGFFALATTAHLIDDIVTKGVWEKPPAAPRDEEGER